MKQLILKYVIDPLVVRLISRINTIKKEKLKKYRSNKLSDFQSVGYGVKLNGDTFTFREAKKIVIGNNVHIGNNAYFIASGGLVIGDNTHISRNVTIYTVNHDYEGRALPYDDNNIHKPVSIGKNVWIGMNVSIAPGITIGEGAIIGIGTIVNRNIEPFEIVGSAKAINLKNRNIKHYNQLSTNKQFGGSNGKMLSDVNIRQFLPSYLDNRNKPIVFVLSTGRSGSASIVNVLNQHPDCKAFHEEIPQLIRLSTQLASETDNPDRILKELEIIFNTKSWNAKNNQLIIHSDQRLWNFIPFLSEYFPNSKFIHLVREPTKAITSMVVRDWYQDDEYFEYNYHDWAKYRLQANKIKVIDEESWKKMDNTQKCCWYWYYVNDAIHNDLSNLDTKRVFRVKLNELSENLSQITEFLDLTEFNFEVLISNKRKKIHDEAYNEMKKGNLTNKIKEELSKYNYSFY